MKTCGALGLDAAESPTRLAQKEKKLPWITPLTTSFLPRELGTLHTHSSTCTTTPPLPSPHASPLPHTLSYSCRLPTGVLPYPLPKAVDFISHHLFPFSSEEKREIFFLKYRRGRSTRSGAGHGSGHICHRRSHLAE